MIELLRPLEPAPLDLSARLGDVVLMGSRSRTATPSGARERSVGAFGMPEP